MELIFPLVIVGLIMWFLVIRPQRQHQKQRTEMLNNVRRNDTVVTGGGIVGKVTKVKDDSEVEVEISSGVTVRVVRHTISQVLSKTEPAKS